MSALTASVIVVASALAAAAATFIVRGVVAHQARRRNHDVGTAVFLQLGVIFAVLLAFVFNEVLNEHETAANAISQECAGLHAVAILAPTLPPPIGGKVLADTLSYLKAVVAEEWPDMEQRRSSASAMAALVALWQGVSRINAGLPAVATVQSQMLSQLSQAHDQRETRLFQMTQHAPLGLWLLMILYSVVLVGFVIFAGVDASATHIFLSAMSAACVAFVLVLIALLDFPFEGALRLDPSDFVATLGRVQALTSGEPVPALR